MASYMGAFAVTQRLAWQEGETPATGAVHVWRHLDPTDAKANDQVPPHERLIPSIRNPLFIMWGFDPDSTDYAHGNIERLINGQEPTHYHGNTNFPLLDKLAKKGYDVCVLIPSDTTDYIQRTAGVMITALEIIHALDAAKSRIPVIGFSAGGLIARLALLLAQRYEGLVYVPGDLVSTYISFDTPHRGANVPLSLQNGFSYYVRKYPALRLIPAFEKRYQAVNSPAARQLAIYHCGGELKEKWFDARPDPLREQLLAEIEERWPQNMTRCAYANGCPDGVPFLDPGQPILSFDVPGINTGMGINYYAMPKNWESNDVFTIGPSWSREVWCYVNRGAQPLDSAPGSVTSFFTSLVNALRSIPENSAFWGDSLLGKAINLAGNSVWPVPRPSCFVPTTSALNLDTRTADGGFDVWNGSPTAPNTVVPFDHWLAAPKGQSELHVAVTARAAEWVANLV